MIGSTLAGRYKIESELGRGGMGIVYKGHDTRLLRPVAIKILSSPELSEQDRTQLLTEARAAAQLNHPNIVTIYDAIEADDQPFVVMEYVEGITLRAIQKPPVKESINYVRQICSALSHAHSKGIIHRDVKPENALLTPEGLVKLMDFGLARRVDAPRATKTGMLVGTFAFMAPELIQGKEPSPQSDLYALGLMLYEFLTGSSPFKTDNLATLINQHLHEVVVPPQQLIADLPEALNELIVQMLEKSPENRPSSAQTVEAILITLQSDQAVELPVLLDQLGVESLSELAHSRATKRVELESEWKRKSYPKFTIPVLETGKKEQILVNRARELASSLQHLNEHRLLLITGMPGIGKSTLTRALMEFMPPDVPPPFWYNFERQQSSGNTLGVLLDHIAGYLEKVLGSGVREEILSYRNSPEHQASSYDVDVLIDALNQPTPLWLIFDNFEAVLSKGGDHFLDDGLEMLFSALKNYPHNAKVIISGLFMPRLNNGEFLLEFGTHPLILHGLEEEFSVEYLRAHGLTDVPDDTLAAIARKLDGHPFALRHAAHYVNALGVDAALDDLQEGMDEFAEHFKASLHQRLSINEFSVLRDLSVLQREISLKGLCEIGQTKASMVKRLREIGLLETSATKKFWMPTIVRDSLIDDDKESMLQAHLRAAEFYRMQKPPVIRQKIDDYANILEWHHHAVRAGDIKDGYKAIFANGLIDQLKEWNEFALAAELCENIYFEVRQEENCLTNTEWVQLNHELGVLYFQLGQLTRSIERYQVALDALPDLDSSSVKNLVLINLAEAHGRQGDVERAMGICEQGVGQLKEKDGLIYGKGLFLRGILYRQMGDFVSAISDLENARKIYESHSSLTDVAYVTGELGIVYYYQNQFAQALENYQRAMQACEMTKDLRGVMIGHLNIGDILLQQQQYEQARNELAEALELARRKKLPLEELMSGLYLAEAQIALKEFKQAQTTLDSLNLLLADSTSASLIGQSIRLQASLFWKTGNISQAVEKFEQALNLLQEPGCEYELAQAQLTLASFYSEQGQIDEAQHALEQAEQGFIAVGNDLGLQAVLGIRKKMEIS